MITKQKCEELRTLHADMIRHRIAGSVKQVGIAEKLLAEFPGILDVLDEMEGACSGLVMAAIGSMERPHIFGYGRTRKEVAAIDAEDIIKALKGVVEITIKRTGKEADRCHQIKT